MTVLSASSLIRNSSFVLRHSLRIRRSPFSNDYKRDADRDQEKGKKLAPCERTDQLRIRFAEIFDDDSKNCVANEKQAGQYSIGLAGARPNKPQDRKQYEAFEKRLLKIRKMARRQNRAHSTCHFWPGLHSRNYSLRCSQ